MVRRPGQLRLLGQAIPGRRPQPVVVPGLHQVLVDRHNWFPRSDSWSGPGCDSGPACINPEGPAARLIPHGGTGLQATPDAVAGADPSVRVSGCPPGNPRIRVPHEYGRTPGEDVPDLYWTEADNDADFNDIEAADAEADLDTYRREIAAARKAVARIISGPASCQPQAAARASRWARSLVLAVIAAAR